MKEMESERVKRESDRKKNNLQETEMSVERERERERKKEIWLDVRVKTIGRTAFPEA